MLSDASTDASAGAMRACSSTTKTVSPAQVSPYGSHVVTQEPSEDNSEDNSEGLTAYQMMMRPRSRPTTAHARVSTDSPTAIRTTPPPRVPRIVRATQATPATPATPRASVPSSATVDLSYSNPTFETNSAFSPRLGLVRHLPIQPLPPPTHVLCVSTSLCVHVCQSNTTSICVHCAGAGGCVAAVQRDSGDPRWVVTRGAHRQCGGRV